jgi:hypothetical protein
LNSSLNRISYAQLIPPAKISASHFGHVGISLDHESCRFFFIYFNNYFMHPIYVLSLLQLTYYEKDYPSEPQDIFNSCLVNFHRRESSHDLPQTNIGTWSC